MTRVNIEDGNFHKTSLSYYNWRSPIKKQVHRSNLTEIVVVSPQILGQVSLVIKCGYPCLLCVNLTTFRTLKQHWQPYSAAVWANTIFTMFFSLNLTLLFENSYFKSPLYINKATQESWNMTPVTFYLPVNYAFIINKKLFSVCPPPSCSLCDGISALWIIGRPNLIFSKPWCFYLQADFFLY